MRVFQTSFSAGQITPHLQTRIGQGIYENGAREITNCSLLMQGGVSRRPGTRKIAEVPGTACRLEGHVYTRSEAYIMAFSPGRLDIFDANGTFIREATGRPWDETTIWTMTVKRYGNYTFIADQSFRTELLQRRGAGDFVMAGLEFDNKHPLYKYAPEGMTAELSSLTAPMTLTVAGTDAHLFFRNGHIDTDLDFDGATLRILSGPAIGEGTATVDVEFAEGAGFRHLDPDPFTIQNGSSRVTVIMFAHGAQKGQTVEFTDAHDLGGINFNGSFTVAEVIDKDRFTITVGQSAATSQGIPTEIGGGASVRVRTTGPTRRWSEPVFSAVRGWPQAVEFHQGRLWIGGGPQLGDAVFGSQVRLLFDFDPGEGEGTDGVIAIAETQTNAVRHLVSADDLIVLGDAGEAYFPSSDEPISQAMIRGLRQSSVGSSYVTPLQYDGAVLFCDIMGQHVYEFVYAEPLAAYVPTPVSALCPELIERPIHGIVYKGSPKTSTPCCIWTMQDGTASIFVSRRAEQVAGWHGWHTEGVFNSFASMNERLYAAVRRTIDGVETMCIEEFDGAGMSIPDCAQAFESAEPTDQWVSPFGEGVLVDIVDAETGAFLDQVVPGPGGAILLGSYASKVLIGLPFTARVETLPPSVVLQDGPTLGQRQRISKVVSQFHETVYAEIDSNVVVNRIPTDVFSAPPPFNGPLQTRQAGWKRAPSVVVESRYSAPFTLLGLLVEVQG